ncbi:hypothetical protein DCAR_0100341 [Daucus carota subsp. sativus]|uniref:Uncharacterized protein n=1 Tax=Daucus carota subsp. sativus TaxID=79200 RepID=A0AAF1AI72_DAUCS|nr:hypothetical protein DCAR_0100341 [Daucus carota subsp. sativus]
MKSQCCGNQEKPTAIDLSALLNLMSPGTSLGVFGDMNLEGRSNGAVMNARHSSSGKSSDSCGINVYINNNVQGVSNSILVGSEVTMGDSGVWLSLKPPKPGKIFPGLIWGLITVFAAFLWFVLLY